MSNLGLFTEARLTEIAAYWRKIPFEAVDSDPMQDDPAINVSRAQLQEYNSNMFQAGGVNFESYDLAAAQTLVDQWLFPLYPFELEEYGSVADLAPPESPDWY